MSLLGCLGWEDPKWVGGGWQHDSLQSSNNASPVNARDFEAVGDPSRLWQKVYFIPPLSVFYYFNFFIKLEKKYTFC
jgi:hypothetical protein